MSSPFSYDYLLTFTGDYNPEVIVVSDAPDKNDPAFYPACQSTCATLKQTFVYQPNLKAASTFLTFNVTKYKITLVKQ